MHEDRHPTALVRQLEAVELLIERREYLKAKAELAELANTFRPVPHTADWGRLCYLEATVNHAVGDYAWARQKASEAYDFFKIPANTARRPKFSLCSDWLRVPREILGKPTVSSKNRFTASAGRPIWPGPWMPSTV